MNKTKAHRAFSFKSFMKSYVNGSVLLILATIVALVLANSDYSDLYVAFCNYEVSLFLGGVDILQHHGAPMTIASLINNMLMAIFFFAVGLEIKREFMVGELSDRKHALLPIIAAVGGIVLPVVIFKLIATDPDVARGAAIPMATDIAFSLGVLSLLGKRVPISLKVFLTALAVVDDLAGIMVIAIFYSGSIASEYLFIAGALIAIMIIGARLRIAKKSFYAIIGIIIWFMFYNSGVHATIAGVLVAFCIPARPFLDTTKYIERIKSNIAQFPFICTDKHGAVILSNKQIGLLKSIESASDNVVSPLQKLEDMLHPVVTFFIIPVFAFVNAGISMEGISISSFMEETTLAVMAGLLLGKFFGIFGFSYLALKLNLASMPKNANYKGIAGVAILGGIGFTVSIFIGNLSYASIPDIGEELLNQAKLGIIVASLIAAVAGLVFFKVTHKEEFHEEG